jgi:hypothetical protein
MNERNSALDRLEERIEQQAARIDDLYRLLEERVPIADSPLTREKDADPARS